MACEWPQVPSSVDLESYFVFTLHASQTLLLTEWTQREVLANHHPVLWYHFIIFHDHAKKNGVNGVMFD